MKYFKHSLLIFAVILYSCNSNQDKKNVQPNEKIFGRWYYANASQSYVEINRTTYTEHLQEINATLTCHIYWKDSLHYELKVQKATGAIKRSLKPGDKIQVEIRELTPNYYRFNLHFKASPQCILLTRQRGYAGPTGNPC